MFQPVKFLLHLLLRLVDPTEHVKYLGHLILHCLNLLVEVFVLLIGLILHDVRLLLIHFFLFAEFRSPLCLHCVLFLERKGLFDRIVALVLAEYVDTGFIIVQGLQINRLERFIIAELLAD